MEVGPDGKKTGWIHDSLARPGRMALPPEARFEAPSRGVDEMNRVADRIIGFPFFTEVNDFGGGAVQLTANER